MIGPTETSALPDEVAEPTELTEAREPLEVACGSAETEPLDEPDALTETVLEVKCGSAETEPLDEEPLTDAESLALTELAEAVLEVRCASTETDAESLADTELEEAVLEVR